MEKYFVCKRDQSPDLWPGRPITVKVAAGIPVPDWVLGCAKETSTPGEDAFLVDAVAAHAEALAVAEAWKPKPAHVYSRVDLQRKFGCTDVELDALVNSGLPRPRNLYEVGGPIGTWTGNMIQEWDGRAVDEWLERLRPILSKLAKGGTR